MSELIRREDAVMAIAQDKLYDARYGEWAGTASEDIEDWIEVAEHLLASVKPVDAVEVVRCRDCKYAEIYDGYYTQICCDNGVIGGYGELWSPDDFCSYGERKE